MNILNNFRIKSEKEDYQNVINIIDKDVVFKGTNLWILIFAIFIASLGLNVNSTAVIIGAMLVSPLMGPIMGLGLGMAINDLILLKKALYNFLFATGVGLATSTTFFLITPINLAHSEILSRTSPNIYDVLIALFGGLAGILATSSKQKGNVIPGVAIATALMPPLCSAGYGLATLKFDFFFGAAYLFLINTVFIALATLITARFLRFPLKHLIEIKAELKAKRIIGSIVLLTILPSIYLGYDIMQQNKFTLAANRFIEVAAVFPNDYLLNKNIDVKRKTITLTYGGETIDEKGIDELKAKLPIFNLQNATLEIKQGFAYLRETNMADKINPLSLVLIDKEKQIQIFKNKLDSVGLKTQLSDQIFKELKAQYPSIQSFILQESVYNTDTLNNRVWFSLIESSINLKAKERKKIEDWMKIRINAPKIILIFD